MSLIPTNSQRTCYLTEQNRGRAGDVTCPLAAILEAKDTPKEVYVCTALCLYLSTELNGQKQFMCFSSVAN